MELTINNRQGFFFSTDALIALIIILSFVLFIYPLHNYVQPDSDIQSDILDSLSNLRVSDIESTYIDSLIAQGKIKDVNKTLLEQIGELYILNYPNVTEARLLAEEVLSDLNTTENIGIWYGTGLVFSRNTTSFESARDVDIARQVISGIEEGQNITGFSARAVLSSNQRTQYFYFGGYVGDGNVSALINYDGNITSEAEIELAANNNFSLYVNDAFIGNFGKSPTLLEPVRYSFPTTAFHSGENTVKLVGNSFYVAGGFIKIHYRGDVPSTGADHVYHFPGIEGLINLYDSFYVPDNLSSMNLLLHINSNYTFFLNIGNKTVYNGSTNGEQTISLSNSVLSSYLNYNTMDGKTVPLRLGLVNASYQGIAKEIDVFSVTDISGSMGGTSGSCFGCDVLTCPTSDADCNNCKICNAKRADSLLIDILLNTTGNRVGLVAYETLARDEDYHDLSDDSASLKAEVAQWDANGNTCICCGINKAIRGFFSDSSPGKLVAYYDFDNSVSANLADKSGSGNNGVVVGSPTSVAGIEGSAFNFVGSGTNYISIPDLLNMSEGSISVWIDPSRDDSQTIFDSSTSSKYFALDIDGSENLRFNFEDSADNDYQDASYDVQNIHTSGWHHVVATWRYGGGTPSVELYLDGVLVDSDGDAAGAMPDFLNPYIGETRSNYYSTWDYEGAIDEFRIYEMPLTEEQIYGLYDTTSSCGNDITEAGEVCDGDYKLCSAGGVNGTRSCNATCSGFLSCDTSASCGNGILTAGESCDDGNTLNHDGCNENCTTEDRYRSMVVMSDGEANVECSEQGVTGDLDGVGGADTAKDDAIQASIDACEDYGIVVHSVGFGTGVDNRTLRAIALNNGCNGSYYYSDATNLSNVYRQIAYSITTEYAEQTISVTGAAYTELFPDSYINFTYSVPAVPYGLYITAESQFDNSAGGTFFIPVDSTPIITHIVSYSGPKWTTDALVNGQKIFDLDSYGSSYIQLGDPYQISLVDSVLTSGYNSANVSIGTSLSNQSAGSAYNKVIFTIVKNASAFTDVQPVAVGCNWSIQLEDDSIISVSIPDEAIGNCFYDSSHVDGLIDNEDDAYQIAVQDLLNQLDLDNNGKVDVVLSEEDFAISLSEITGIPYEYSTEVQVRRWV